MSFPVRELSREVRAQAARLIESVDPGAVAPFMAVSYEVLFYTHREDAAALAASLRGDVRPYGFDFETSGWSPAMPRPTLSGETKTVDSLSPSQPDIPLVPIIFQLHRAGSAEPVHVVAGEFLHLFLPWLRDEAELVGANLPFEGKVIRRNGGRLPRVHFDTIHGDYLLAETTRQWRHDLKSVVRDRLGLDPLEFKHTTKGKSFDVVLAEDPRLALEYASFDAWDCGFLYLVLKVLLQEQPSRAGYDSLWDYYCHVERSIGQAVAHVDDAGMPILPDVTREKSVRLLKALDEVDARCYAAMGRIVNLSSPKELNRYFYAEKNYPVCTTTEGFECILCDKKVTEKNGTHACKIHGRGAMVNSPTIDENALLLIAGKGDIVAPIIIERREIDKQIGSYVETFFTRSSAIPPEAQHLYSWADDCPDVRVMHPSLNATDVVSGRLAAPVVLLIPKQGFKDQIGFPEDSPWTLVDIDFCFAVGTMIDTPRGHLPIEALRPGDPVYSYDAGSRRPTVGTVNHSISRGERDSVMVHLDNGQVVRCTPDHKWLVCPKSMRDGNPVEVEARDLTPGARLLPIRRSWSGPGLNYETLYSHQAIEYSKAHIVVAEWAMGPRPKGAHVHHKDQDQRNNSPENLEYVNSHDHISSHSKAACTESWKDPEVKKKRVSGIKKSLQERGGHNGANNPRFGDRRQREDGICAHCGGAFSFFKSGPRMYCKFECYNNARKRGNNHKVVKVEPASPTDVWSIGVEGFHNYALSAGVFVKNCQIELRVMAELSQDAMLLEAFAAKRDLHAWTGALVEAYMQHGERALTDADLRLQVYNEIRGAKKAAGLIDEAKKAARVAGVEPVFTPLTERQRKLLTRRDHGKCFHPDTEALTRKGWKRITTLQADEEVVQAWPVTGGQAELEWAVPTEVTTMYHPSERLVMLKGETVEMGLTPDHRTAVLRGGRHEVTTPGQVQRSDCIVPGGILPGSVVLTDRQRADLRAAIATQADGHYEEDGKIDLRFLKERKITRLREVLGAANISYRVFPRGGDGKTRFSIPAGPARRVRNFLDSRKRLTWQMLDLDEESRRIILDEIVHWDSSIEDGGFRYSTKHKQCADVAQALAASLGLRSRVSQDRLWWRTRISDPSRNLHSMVKMHQTEEVFTDEVACLSVPSTFLLCRFRGTTFISGQTLNFAVLYGTGDDAMAQKLGVTVEEAKRIREAIMKMYSGMAEFIDRSVQELIKNPVLITLGGRHKTILEVQSPDQSTREKGTRLSTNQRCQCGARDLLMLSKIQVDMDIEAGGGYGREGRGSYGRWVDGRYTPDFDRLPKRWREELPKALRENLGGLGRMGARIINSIHDELLFVAPKAYAREVAERATAIMEDPGGLDLVLSVPITTEATEGSNWQECKGAG